MAVGILDRSESIIYDGGGHGSSAQRLWQAGHPPTPDMSYSQFGAPLDDPEQSMSQSGYPASYDVPARQGPPSLAGPPNWQLQRSMSTPDASGMHQAVTQMTPVSSSERKRNKLGYHRTSVACSHCRRRKIRCIPSASDSQGRCANCIRLKKECSFIPTEQQQGPDSRLRGSGQAHVDSEPPSEQSSPGGLDMSGTKPSPPSYATLGSSGLHGMGTPAMGEPATGDRILGPMASSGPPYALDQSVPQWMPVGSQPFVDGSTMSWNNPWQTRPMDSPISESNPGTRSSSTWAPTMSEAAPRDMSWGQIQVPGRSFSYSGESVSSQNPAQYVPVSQGAPTLGGQTTAHPFANVPGSLGGIGEGYSQHSMAANEPPISPAGMPPSAQMQWMQPQQPQQQGVVRPRGPFGSWMHEGTNQTRQE